VGVACTSLPEAEVACAGSQVVCFVGQTTAAPARLTQASFADLDLLLADSVARAAQLCGVERIVCPADAPEPVRLHLARGEVPVQVVAGGASALAAAIGVTDTALEAAPARASPQRSVLSVQRFGKPAGWTAEKLAFAYADWVGSAVPLVASRRVGDAVQLGVAGVGLLTLLKSTGRCRADSFWYSVPAGALVGGAGEGRFEFRTLLGGAEAMVVLAGFEPALPWPVYRITQAVAHAVVMRRFARWVAQQA
jgi:hypothetical protein